MNFFIHICKYQEFNLIYDITNNTRSTRVWIVMHFSKNVCYFHPVGSANWPNDYSMIFVPSKHTTLTKKINAWKVSFLWFLHPMESKIVNFWSYKHQIPKKNCLQTSKFQSSIKKKISKIKWFRKNHFVWKSIIFIIMILTKSKTFEEENQSWVLVKLKGGF